MTFKGLHDTIQAAFLWFDSHLWEFGFAGRRYGLPYVDGFGDENIDDANTARLTKLRNAGITEFLYLYDMGDNWQHRIEMIDLFVVPKGSRLPRFRQGQWRTPPEDIGGAPGFEMFLEAMADPAHEEHDNLIDWFGEPFDREDIQPDILNIQMGRLANMRRPKK